MNWIVINEQYLDYLRKIERRIPNSNYGDDNYKPFFGLLFETDKFYYVTQVSHPQNRHINMKANIDFKKIYDPVDGHLIAVVNLNYMFPIPKNMLEYLKYKDIDKHRTFESETAKSKYIDLLKTELKVINSMKLTKAALNVYENKYRTPTSDLAKRCIDFKAIEAFAEQYNE